MFDATQHFFMGMRLAGVFMVMKLAFVVIG